ncbi:hypothetical protein [Streptomyces humi]
MKTDSGRRPLLHRSGGRLPSGLLTLPAAVAPSRPPAPLLFDRGGALPLASPPSWFPFPVVRRYGERPPRGYSAVPNRRVMTGTAPPDNAVVVNRRRGGEKRTADEEAARKGRLQPGTARP